jgi:hypothetical protein
MTKNRLLFARPKPDSCSGKQAAGIAAVKVSRGFVA